MNGDLADSQTQAPETLTLGAFFFFFTTSLKQTQVVL
jgi:hypothetical protein